MTDPTLPMNDPAPPPPPPPNEPRRLTRSSSDRVLGGVAGGLGRYFAVDPILFRIGFLVLVLAGGGGIIAYLALLLLVPSDDAAPGSSPRAEQRTLLILAGGLLAVLVLGTGFVFWPGLLVLAAAAGLVYLALVLARGDGDGDWRHNLGRLLLVLFVLALAATLGLAGGVAAAFGGGAIVAALVIAAGLGLVIAAFAGGARWLIVPALVLAAPLAIVAAADIEIDGGVGERFYRPTTAEELRGRYELGMGELVLDLRDVDLPTGRTNVAMEVGIGEARVLVPPDVCVSTDVEVGAGYAEVLGVGSGGVDVAYAADKTPEPGRSLVHVDADIGIGHLDIDTNEFDGWDRDHRGPFGRGFLREPDAPGELDPVGNQACTVAGG